MEADGFLNTGMDLSLNDHAIIALARLLRATIDDDLACAPSSIGSSPAGPRALGAAESIYATSFGAIHAQHQVKPDQVVHDSQIAACYEPYDCRTLRNYRNRRKSQYVRPAKCRLDSSDRLSRLRSAPRPPGPRPAGAGEVRAAIERPAASIDSASMSRNTQTAPWQSM
jgi:hypothetical protein